MHQSSGIFITAAALLIIRCICSGNSTVLSQFLSSNSCPFLYGSNCSGNSCNETCSFNETLLSASNVSISQNRSLTLIGSSPSSSAIVLSAVATSAISVAASATLNLTRLSIENATILKTDGVDGLQLAGINLEGSSAKLIVQDSYIHLDCASWVAIKNLACEGFDLLTTGTLQVNGSMGFAPYLRSEGVTWLSVTLPAPPSCSMITPAVCQSVTLPPPASSDESNVMNDTSSSSLGLMLWAQINEANQITGGDSSLVISLDATSAYQLPELVSTSAMLPVQCNVTISGPTLAVSTTSSTMMPVLDMNLMNFQMVGPSSFLTLQNLVLVNKPTVPSLYPAGLLTMLPNDPGLDNPEMAVSGLRMILNNVTIVVPDDELQYLLAWFRTSAATSTANGDGSINASWALQPQGPFQALPVLCYNNVSSPQEELCLQSLTGAYGSWEYKSSSIVGSTYPMKAVRRINKTGLQPSTDLLLPWENSLLDLPLTQVTTINSSNSLFNLLSNQMYTYNSSSGASTAVQQKSVTFSSTHFILSETVNLKLSQSGKPMYLTASAVVVGDPTNPTRLVLDMLAPRGLLHISSGSGSSSSPSPQLFLRSLVLNNLLPAQPPPGSILSSEQVFMNYTSMIWSWQFSRNFTQPDSGLSGAVILSDVVMVLPAVEIQVYRDILNGHPPISVVNAEALSYLSSYLLLSQVKLQGPDIDLAYLQNNCPQTQLTCNASRLPGDIVFTSLVWLGMSGSNVTFTAHAPVYNVSWTTYSFNPFSILIPVINGLSAVGPQPSAAGGPIRPGGAPALSSAGKPPRPSLSPLQPLQALDPPQAPKPPQASKPSNPPQAPKPPQASKPYNPPQAPKPPQASKPSDSPSPTSVAVSSTAPSSGNTTNMSLVIGLVVGLVLGGALLAALAWLLILRHHERNGGTNASMDAHSLKKPALLKTAVPCFWPDMDAHSPATSMSPHPPNSLLYADSLLPVLKSKQMAIMTGVELQSSNASLIKVDYNGAASSDGLSSSSIAVALGGPNSSSGPIIQSSNELHGIPAVGDGVLPSSLLGSSTVDNIGRPNHVSTATALQSSSLIVSSAGTTESMRWGLKKQLEGLREQFKGGDLLWEVTEQLGRGGYGTVYKGTWRGLQVAIKRVIFQVMADKKGEERRLATLQEAAINETLNHPNLVMTYASEMTPLGDLNANKRGLLDWQMHIIMDYCEGGSLQEAIRQNRLYDTDARIPQLASVLELLAQIAQGCAYIHSKNIIHGDLKPDNVLLKTCRSNSTNSPPDNGSNGNGMFNGSVIPYGLSFQAKIADFGLSKSIHGNNTHVSGVKQGTPLYVAPEILREGRSSKAADVYSFGVMMWELYHGLTAYSQYAKLAAGDSPALNAGKSGVLLLAPKVPIDGRLLSLHSKLFSYDPEGTGQTSFPPSYASLGAACTDEEPSRRPTFQEVLTGIEMIKADLDSLLAVDEPTSYWAPMPQHPAPGPEEPFLLNLEPDPEDDDEYLGLSAGHHEEQEVASFLRQESLQLEPDPEDLP
ncbi:hypothetical protein CEUSTIGMA_g5313.t1 [Chlamydomonas eustigma]|uniref:Protein kinase domain-containing protein n=1 Tax=Chlamydomonas eustigma TaxID=1157962 RepID=A0A250X473_9CHLO|nr:hypothetical protein CEUSTIGMA_g5313.t1 [Chlamydomonas eustigma]|eukprot:GAX77871.1 hypothetical protein CEUSTIGMA_g5313.t1 [Chlamydomonas eustigma]